MTQSKTCSQKFQAVSPKLKELGAFHSWELKLAWRTKAESRKKERKKDVEKMTVVVPNEARNKKIQ